MSRPSCVAQVVERVVGRERAQHQHGRIARDELHQKEADQQDADELRTDEEQPPGDIESEDRMAGSRPPRGATAGDARSNSPARARRRAGSDNTSTLAPISAKAKTVTARARPGKIDGHQWPGHDVLKSHRNHAAPFGRRRLDAGADEAERSGEKHRPPDIHRQLGENRRDGVRDDVADEDERYPRYPRHRRPRHSAAGAPKESGRASAGGRSAHSRRRWR